MRRFLTAAATLSLGGMQAACGSLPAETIETRGPAASVAAPKDPSETTYEVTHALTVKDIPQGAKEVRVWFWMPEDRPQQKVLDFAITEAPEGVRITRDPEYGSAWIHAEAAADPTKPVKIVTKFKLRRSAVRGLADAAKAEPLTDLHRRTFVRELRRDERHMEVTPELQKIADELCGAETNPVVQAKKIFDFVVLKSDHYSKSGPAPKGKCLGDAMECLGGTGDCCTDQHALFIALARARGIPCRLHFGSRLKMENEGKDYDPGYRCWPTFFAPGLGWVPLDISSGDATKDDDGDNWFGGLDDRRIQWAEGRDFSLTPQSAVHPDLVIRAWVEVDGKPLVANDQGRKDFTRTINFRRVGAE
jgi:transglutaminase-like putative cysteine protease